MFNGFYQGKRVLVTGHTGFKGGWVSLWLKQLGAAVWGVSLPPPTHPNLHEIIKSHAFADEIECDIRHLDALAAAVKKIQPEVIFHMAAQPLVRRSYLEPLETFETNAVGTANLLESVRRAELNCIVIVITSDKCYENREWDFAYRENDPLGGHDIYSKPALPIPLPLCSSNRCRARPRDRFRDRRIPIPDFRSTYRW